MADKAEIKQVFQVCVVVRDIELSVERYWNLFGIGPWQIHTFRQPDLFDTTLRGKPESYSMKIASAQIGNIQWELIQPLSGRSSYREFLDEKGEGLHHVAVVVDDFEKVIASLEKHGIGTVMTGKFRESTYAYLDTGPALGFITEILKMPPGFKMPEPDAIYPPSA
jgi:methylmalonyl-CoA/ethylmalonyl-CoA epimerase